MASPLDASESMKARALPNAGYWRKSARKVRRHWQLYLVIVVPMIYILLFKYVPMVGNIIAFKDYNPIDGMFGSDWAGLKYFRQFIDYPYFWNYIENTLLLNLLGLLIGFPAPILLALALNEVGNAKFKKTVQMVTYAPYFISTVVVVSILMLILSPRTGFVNQIVTLFGFETINFMGEPEYFRSIYVLSDLWQSMGYSAIIYIAALAGVNPELYEAAKMDGASRLQKIWKIDIPSIVPVIVILLILNVGNMMNVGFEKIYLMQNTLNLSTSEVIATYVYKVGLLNANFSFSTAIGLFNAIINMLLLFVVNAFAKRISQTSLW